MSASDQIQELSRQLLKEKLAQVTQAERDFFERMWRSRYRQGDIVSQMSASHIRSSIDLLDRTIEASKKKGAE